MNSEVPTILPRAPFRRRVRRLFSRTLPVIVWVVGALAAGWLFSHERPRGEAIASADNVTEGRRPSLVRGTRMPLKPHGKRGATITGRADNVSSRIGEVPERLHRELSALPRRGPNITIELDPPDDFSPGELNNVNSLTGFVER